MRSQSITIKRSEQDEIITIRVGSLVITVSPGMTWFGTDDISYQPARHANDDHAIGTVEGTVFVRRETSPAK